MLLKEMGISGLVMGMDCGRDRAVYGALIRTEITDSAAIKIANIACKLSPLTLVNSAVTELS